MACSKCGGEHEESENPLDCGSRFMSCHNPCHSGPKNSAKCESLPSQIENFTLQFFGTVIKTEINGTVIWSLPCSLDVGLPNNPRGIDEGLACYFLRLFHDGIVGLTGPTGAAGTAGTNGHNAFTVTLASFTQPSISSPVVQVTTQFNPAIIPGIYVNIATSGWYSVNETDGNGTLLLTLVKPIAGAGATITAGKLVVPSGFPGASITGSQGPQGATGPVGPSGSTLTTTNGFYFATVGTDWPLPVVYAPVDFVNSAPQILLPNPGLYLVTVICDVRGQAGISATEFAALKLRNTSIAADVPGSEHNLTVSEVNNFGQIAINVRLETDSPNQTISLFGKCSSAGKISALALNTTITYVRIQ